MKILFKTPFSPKFRWIYMGVELDGADSEGESGAENNTTEFELWTLQDEFPIHPVEDTPAQLKGLQAQVAEHNLSVSSEKGSGAITFTEGVSAEPPEPAEPNNDLNQTEPSPPAEIFSQETNQLVPPNSQIQPVPETEPVAENNQTLNPSPDALEIPDLNSLLSHTNSPEPNSEVSTEPALADSIEIDPNSPEMEARFQKIMDVFAENPHYSSYDSRPFYFSPDSDFIKFDKAVDWKTALKMIFPEFDWLGVSDYIFDLELPTDLDQNLADLNSTQLDHNAKERAVFVDRLNDFWQANIYPLVLQKGLTTYNKQNELANVLIDAAGKVGIVVDSQRGFVGEKLDNRGRKIVFVDTISNLYQTLSVPSQTLVILNHLSDGSFSHVLQRFNNKWQQQIASEIAQTSPAKTPKTL